MTSGQRILLVCPDEARLRQLEATLQRAHYDTRSTRSAGEALKQYEAWPADLVVSDYRLQGLQDLQLVDLLRRMNGRVRFILLFPPGSRHEFETVTPNRVVAYLREDAGDHELLLQVHHGFGLGENFNNRRQYSRFKLSFDTQCILINPFNNTESRPIACLVRDVSRSGLSMIVRQVLPVPSMLKLIIDIPQTRRSITMLAKSLSCTLTQIPNVYRLGVKFVGLLPPEMEDAIGQMDESEIGKEPSDIFMGKPLKRAVEEWLHSHQDVLGNASLDPATPLPRLADEVCATQGELE